MNHASNNQDSVDPQKLRIICERGKCIFTSSDYTNDTSPSWTQFSLLPRPRTCVPIIDGWHTSGYNRCQCVKTHISNSAHITIQRVVLLQPSIYIRSYSVGTCQTRNTVGRSAIHSCIICGALALNAAGRSARVLVLAEFTRFTWLIPVQWFIRTRLTRHACAYLIWIHKMPRTTRLTACLTREISEYWVWPM